MLLSSAGVFSSGGGGVTNPFPAGEQGIFLDASDTSTLFQDAAGTTPVTAAGQPVGRWEDKSGNAYIFHQTTSTKRPLYGTDGTLHWVDFDGVDDGMVSTTNVDMSLNDEVSVFIGVECDEVKTGIILELSANPNSNNGVFVLNQSITPTYWFNSKGTVFSAASATIYAVGTPNVIFFKSKISSDLNEVYKNGSLTSSSSQDQGSGNFGSHEMNIGARNESLFFFHGRIYSLMVFGRLATAQEQTDIEQFMASKAGVQL